MSKLYLDSGYPDINYLDSRGLPFNILMGGRGTGKTYGVLKYYYERGDTILYLRRTAEKAKISASREMCPYKTLFNDLGVEYDIPKSIIKALYVDGREKPVAYFGAMSTFGNVRGFDGSDCAAIVYDEFIPEGREHPFRGEDECVFSAYETVNRNRELNGNPPTKMWLLSNTNEVMSPILQGLGLIDIALKMERTRTEQHIDHRRGLQMIMYYESPISERKKDTALYRLAGERYKKMAIENSFQFGDDLIVSRNLNGYDPLVTLGEITIYREKVGNMLYATTHKRGSPPVFSTSEQEIARFMRTYGKTIYEPFLLGYMEFEKPDVFYILQLYFKS